MLTSERRDDVFAERGERLGRREVAEPRVDALDALLGEPSVVRRPARAPVPITGRDQPKRRVASAVMASRSPSRPTSATICWIDTRASPTCGRSSSILWSWPTCTFHQSANSRTSASVFGPMPPMTIGMCAERARLLPRAVQLVVAAVVVDDLAGPQRAHHLQRLAQPLDACRAARSNRRRTSRTRRVPNPIRCRARSGRRTRGRSRPPGGRAPPGWRNASHSTSDPTRSRSVCAASHVVVTIASNIGWSSASGGTRWSMPVMPTNPAASAARARATELVERQPHLRQEQVELHRAANLASTSRCLSCWRAMARCRSARRFAANSRRAPS